MRASLSVALPAALVSGCVAHSQGQIIMSPASSGGLEAIKVEYTFRGDDDGETTLVFPDEWGPEANLYALISRIEVVGGVLANSSDLKATDGKIAIQHGPADQIRVSYLVTQDYDGEPQCGVHRVPGMRPILQPTYATLIGHTFLPTFESDIGRRVTVMLSEFPPDINVAFSHDTAANRSSEPLSINQVRNSVFAFGELRYSEVMGEDILIRTSVRGTWPLSDEHIRRITKTVLEEAADLFEDGIFDQYYVVLSPLPELPEGSAVIGTGLEESFFILATPNAEPANLEQTIVHEVLHEWITRRMGETDEASDPARAWFIEGFTEYYTHLILLRAGRSDLDSFLASMNTLWLNYQLSPESTLPIEFLPERIWQSREAERLPYQRGALLAFHWDTVTRSKAGGSLADALIALLRDANRDRAKGKATTLNDQKINSALSQVIGERFDRDYAQHLQAGELLEADDLLIPSCLTVVQDKQGIFEWRLASGSTVADCTRVIVGE